MELIAQGAEAKIYATADTIVKVRQPKAYRIPEIDTKILRSRIQRESKILTKLEKLGVPAPRLIKVEGNALHMQRINGPAVRDYVNDENYEDVMLRIGVLVARMHSFDIIHGDLTTLNFIISDDVYVIDFGLSFFSAKDEDKAVDLYVFEKALRCVHGERYIESFYRGYASHGEPAAVMSKLEQVRKRGRKREEQG
ncbi:TP53 regulating kinase [Pancytospora philotis]|nr:TP53 regulating kinase [Pancytospora philotis]KAI4292391.1 TP53 regulating kinase [Pancytospora philotis]